jgi:hypothetical protein
MPDDARNEERKLKPLARERDFFESELNSLLGHHSGEFVLIKGTDVLGFYRDAREAYEAGQAKFGFTPFFIARVDRSLEAVAANDQPVSAWRADVA